MKENKKDLIDEWFNNFNHNAAVEYKNKEYTITEPELKSIYSTGNYWHHRTDPSSWLCEALVRLAKRKFGNRLPRKQVIQLCAQLLNITPEKVESTLDWNANYMAWHDGGTVEENHVWKEE
ncbi:MAG: hypothetical protein JXJ04_07150 [Spirochaetales bacterium]|nr:hypothetical protein [Spirochaetales bacterium]